MNGNEGFDRRVLKLFKYLGHSHILLLSLNLKSSEFVTENL